MKKMYSLFATVMVATGIFAQTLFSANFNDVIGTGGNDGLWNGSIAVSGFANGSTSYTTGGAWTLSNAFKGNQCLKLGTSSLKGSVTTPPIATGNAATLKLSFRIGAWDGASEGNTVKVLMTGAIAGGGSELPVFFVKGNFINYIINDINVTGTGPVTFTFEGLTAANSRFFIDDIMVEKVTTLATNEVLQSKYKFVKNTSVDNEIFFDSKSDVKVYSANGSLIKTASVSESKSLNISEFPKGVYIVTGVVNNRPVSQKILKN